jgi:flagellar assembly protein FliH
MMRNASKVTFDTVFATGHDVASDAALARRRKTLTEGEIEFLRAEARAEGLRAGEVRALETLTVAVREVAAAARVALDQASQEIEALRAESAAIALALARKLAHAALEAFPSGEVEAALREAMHQAIGEPRIVLRAAPRVAEALADRIGEIAHEEGYDGRVQISGDAALHGADCRIEWRGGGAERASAAIDAALGEVIGRRFQDAQIPKLTEE